MDIIKAFENNETAMHITIRGTHEEPLFRASDIGEVLEMTNIRQSIQDFDNTEKHGVSITDIIGREQETTFLTEKGLYKLLFKSRKPIAKQFTDWVCEVIKEIRLNGKYELEKQLEIKDKEIEQIKKESKKIVNDNIINNYKHTEVVYMGYAEHNVIKIGYTKDIEERLSAHRREIRKDFSILYIFKTIYYRRLEDAIMKDSYLNNFRIEKAYLDGEIKKELFELNDKFTAKMFYEYVLKLKKDIEKEDLLIKENTELRNENLQLKLNIENIEKLQEENKELRVETGISFLNKDGTEMIDLQTNTMRHLVKKNVDLRRAVYYNFLINFISENIDNQTISISNDNFFKQYKQFRISNCYTESLYNEPFEKGMLTNAFSIVTGYKTDDTKKTFDTLKIIKWIRDNIKLQKRHDELFNKYIESHDNDDICLIGDLENANIYNFLIYLILKFATEQTNDLQIKHSTITSEYKNFKIKIDSNIN